MGEAEDMEKIAGLTPMAFYFVGIIFLLIGIIVLYYGLHPCLDKHRTKIIVGMVFTFLGAFIVLLGSRVRTAFPALFNQFKQNRQSFQ
jgi:ascorbate-specific PTS system EIIC-type component UlaA